jgi:predicted ArsR family transcriptional regulator
LEYFYLETSSSGRFSLLESSHLQRLGEAAEWVAAVADPTRMHILRSLSSGGMATAAELAAAIATSPQTLRRHLEALVVSGVLREHPGQSDGATPGRPASRFSLSRPETGDSIRRLLGVS